MAKELFVDAIDDSVSRWKIYQSRHKSSGEPVRGNQKRIALRDVSEIKKEQKSDGGEIEGLSKTLATDMTEGFLELNKQLTELLKANNKKVSEKS